MHTSRRLAATVVLAAALLTGTTACTADDAGTTAQAGSDTLDPVAFGELASGEGVVLLDVRTAEEYAAGHLAGATLLSLENGDLAAALDSLDPTATYAVYCRSDNRSGQALALMQEAGFTDAAHLDGGIVAWQEAGGEVVLD